MGAAVGAAKEVKGLSSQLEDVSAAARVLEKAATSNIASWQRCVQEGGETELLGQVCSFKTFPFPWGNNSLSLGSAS